MLLTRRQIVEVNNSTGIAELKTEKMEERKELWQNKPMHTVQPY